MRRARLPDFISVLPFQKICFQSFSRTLSTQSNLPCLPFTSVIVYCHPPLLELEHLKTKDAIEDHQARLETHVPDLLAKFCTPKSNGNFQVREMVFSASTPIEDVLSRVKPHFPAIADMCLVHHGRFIASDVLFQSLLEDKKKLGIRITMTDGSVHEVSINAPGFGTTIAFFKWCAMAMAMAISVWHAYKPEKGVDPEFQQYSREHQFQRLSNGVEDPKLARSLMQDRIAQEELARGIIWREMEKSKHGEQVVDALPWAPKRTFKRIDELEAGHSTVDSMTIVTKESSSLPDEKSP